jgi:long-chain acyl-CoA synthetase
MGEELLSANGVGVAAPPLCPSQVFAGKRIVVVGGTGFLGKVWVAMILHRFPELGHMHLLVRPKDDQSAEERFWSQIVTSPVFDPLRERYPGAAFEAYLKEKVTPVAGDIVEPLLGLGEALIAELTGKVAAVVNVAGVVDFNPPLDEALDVNAFGVNNLASLARALQASVMHTSTCYVAGYRSGQIDEDDPRDVLFPRSTGESWFGSRNATSRTLDRSHWDPQNEIAECLDLVKQARHRCDDAFRQSAFLDEAKENLRRRGEPCRGGPLEDELAKVKRRFIESRLVEAGKERSLFWGWSNIYTYTKSIGEQVLAGSGVPFTIVRPAVIESACTFPFPGWNEGINTSAPFLYMASKGQVQFPGDPAVHLDIIPVDMVASGMIASLAELIDGRAPPVYHYGTTDTNGCKMNRYLEIAGLYKRKQLHEGKRSGLFEHVMARFEPRGQSKKDYQAHGAPAIASALRGLGGVLGKLGIGPAKAVFGPAAKALQGMARTESKLAEIQELFIPFTAESDWIFSCANTRAVMDRMPPEERARFYWEPEKIDWRQWMFEIHLPGLEKWVYPLIEEKMKRELQPLRRYDTLVDLLDEMAERHDLGVALQRVEPDGLSRVSFRAWRDASLAAAARLAALGVKPGDRVILSGNNQPAWPIAYYGIVYAGAVAVPVDPTLDAAQLGNIVRSSGARAAIWGVEVEAKGGQKTRAEHPELQVFDLCAITEEPNEPDAAAISSTAIAPAVSVKSTDLASIIYTSGTTGDPKGVMLSHGNFTSLLASLGSVFPLTQNDRVLSVLPLHHTFEFACGMLLPLSRGARIVYLAELSAEHLGEGLQKGRITAMVGVPALWQLLERRILARVKEQGPAAAMAFNWTLELNRLLGTRLGVNAGRLFFGTVHEGLGGHVRHLISGGAALPKDTARLFSGLGLPLSEGYGLTEASPVLTVAKASVKSRPGHVGKAIPGVEIKIDNPDASGVGEVLARGPNVMVGYAGNEAATSQAIDADGWLHTGDLGKLDKRSQLVIVGRHKDVIVGASGENVYPDDVETLLGAIAHVKELAIVGIDDGRGGERVACLAVPEPEATADGGPESRGPMSSPDGPPTRRQRHERALAALREAFLKLPRTSQPAVVHLYDADLPRTATRKTKRAEVKVILERLVAATAPLSSEIQASGDNVSAVRQAIAAIAGKKASELGAQTSFKGDLAFDSLMVMELSVALEAQTGASLDGASLARCETVGEVERLVGESSAPASRWSPRGEFEKSGAGDDSDRRSRAGRSIEGMEDERIVLPAVVAETAKRYMTMAQMGFYDKVMRPKVYGRAYIPHNRNTIVASNHASHLDMGFVKYALGAYGDGIVSLAAQDYFFDGNRWRRAYVENLTNLAAFDRKGGLRQALRQAGEVIERGSTVLLFPEGTRSADGAIHEFKPAVGHLALTHEVDILPVYLGGTYQAMPKGSRIPIGRDIVARIGLPLCIADLKRLTEGMKSTAASRKVAELAHQAVCALRDGEVLDLSRIHRDDAPAPVKEHPLVVLFRELEGRFVPSRVAQPITYYFTLGNETEAKWTLRVAPDGCEARVGKPANTQADCVLKTSAEIFTKIVREAYTPSPMEFMTGAVKSNDIALLQTFQKVFDLA